MKNQIRSIAFKFLILFCLLYVVDLAIGAIFNNMSDKVLEKSPNASRTAFTMEKVDSDVLIMGSSRANHHYVPSVISDSLNKTVFNCGLDGQNFAYSLAMIHAVLKRYTPQIIIVDVSPQMLASNYSFGNLSELYPYYNDDEFYAELLLKDDANNRYKMSSRMFRYNSRLIDMVGHLLLPDYVHENGYAALPVKGYIHPELSYAEFEKNIPVDSSQVIQVQACINMCKAKNVELIFSVSPSYQESNMSQVHAYKNLVALLDINNTPFIFMGDNTVINDPLMYKDGTHLNHNGAVAFTKVFVQKIQDYHIPFASND